MKFHRRHLALLGLLIGLASGWVLFQRNQREELWGQWTLILFLAFYMAFLLRRKALAADFLHRRRQDWAVLSGLLLGLAFPDIIPKGFLVFVAWIPLLRLEEDLKQEAPGRSWRLLAGYSYPAFVLWNILATYWVANASLLAGVFAIVVNSGLMLVPWVLAHVSRIKLPGLGYLPFVVYWLGFEYLHHRWELAWPWLTLGNSLADYPSWLQWYEYTGVLGGSLWILGINVLLFLVIREQERRLRLRRMLPLFAVVFFPLTASLLRYAMYEEKGEPVELVAVQPNYEPHYEKHKIPESGRMDRMIALAESALHTHSAYLIYPESSIGYADLAQLSVYPPMQRFQELLAAHPRLTIICGLDAYRFLSPDEPSTRGTREQENANGQKLRFEVMNAAIELRPGSFGDPVPLYLKSKLVPGPERFPYPQLLGFLRPLVERLGGTMAGFADQKDREVFSGGLAKAAPVICYESVFGAYMTAYIHRGAELIFIVTNDGWWGNTPGHRQHLKYASLRAIETRRSIARAASTGISAFIGQKGEIRQQTRYGAAAAIKGQLRTNQELTFYVLWGDVIGRLSLAMSVLLLLNVLVKSLIPKP